MNMENIAPSLGAIAGAAIGAAMGTVIGAGVGAIVVATAGAALGAFVGTQLLHSATNLPKPFVRLSYWLTNSSNMLLDEATQKSFDFLSKIVMSALQDNTALPTSIDTKAHFKNAFHYKKEKECIYVFEKKNLLDIKALLDSYNQVLPFKGRRHKPCPITDEIITEISTSPTIMPNKRLSLTKIIFGYIISMALEIPYQKESSEKLKVVKHLQKIIDDILIYPTLSSKLNNGDLLIIKKIDKECKSFIEPAELYQQVSQRVTLSLNLRNNIDSLIHGLLEALLGLTEGGNRNYLLTSRSSVARGIISVDSKEKVRFTDDNPFKPLIQESFRCLPGVSDTQQEINLHKMSIPNLSIVKNFIKKHLGHGTHLSSYITKKNIGNQVLDLKASDDEQIEQHAHNLICIASWVFLHRLYSNKIMGIKFFFGIASQSDTDTASTQEKVDNLLTFYSNALAHFIHAIDTIKKFYNLYNDPFETEHPERLMSDNYIASDFNNKVLPHTKIIREEIKKVLSDKKEITFEEHINQDTTITTPLISMSHDAINLNSLKHLYSNLTMKIVEYTNLEGYEGGANKRRNDINHSIEQERIKCLNYAQRFFSPPSTHSSRQEDNIGQVNTARVNAALNL